MTLKLDHVVVAVHDLDAAIADYTDLGFQVQVGGAHPGRSTHNALVVFEDGSYFELIAWRAPAPQERWWQLLQRDGEGIVDFALLPADTARTVAQAAAAGLVLDGPTPGGRVRPDGQELRWETARPGTADLPFLCGDRTPRVLRVPGGAAAQHDNGATGIASLAVAVHDVDLTLARYRALLGAAATGSAAHLPDGRGHLATVHLSGSTLVLCAPPTAAGVVREGPYAVVLSTAGGVPPSAIDAAQAHGARIELAARATQAA